MCNLLLWIKEIIIFYLERVSRVSKISRVSIPYDTLDTQVAYDDQETTYQP